MNDLLERTMKVIARLEVPDKIRDQLRDDLHTSGRVVSAMRNDIMRSLCTGVVQVHPAFGHLWYRLLRRAIDGLTTA